MSAASALSATSPQSSYGGHRSGTAYAPNSSMTVAAPSMTGPAIENRFSRNGQVFDASAIAEPDDYIPEVDPPPIYPHADLSSEPAGPAVAKTLFFGALQQQPVVPRLVVIKGEGGDGATYHLQGTTTVIGRITGDITFSEDPFLSPEHARFTSQTGRLFVQDLGSENGVFLRIKKPTAVDDGTRMLVGEQLLELRNTGFADGFPNHEGTYYYGSPRPTGRYQVVQRLAGGGEGRVATADNGVLSIGREGNTLNFPDDRFISGHHARLDASGDSDGVMLTDTGSRNGTFIRIEGAQELVHGDYLFVGQQLLRVEIA